MKPSHSHEHEEEHEELVDEVADEVEHRIKGPGFLKRLLIALIINTLAMVAVLMIVKGITFTEDTQELRMKIRVVLIAGLLIGLANGILKPIIKLFSFPLILLSLGLFLLVINLVVFWLIVDQVPGLVVTGGFASYFWGSVVLSAVNTLEHMVIKLMYRK